MDCLEILLTNFPGTNVFCGLGKNEA